MEEHTTHHTSRFSRWSNRPIFERAAWVVGILIVALLIFKAGEFVGFHKAAFSYRWGENYYRSFEGSRRGFFMDLNGRDFLVGHGTSGSIMSVSSSSIIVQEQGNVEKVVLVTNDTLINSGRQTIAAADLKAGSQVIVIGSPNDTGQIKAKLIRVLPSQQQATQQ